MQSWLNFTSLLCLAFNLRNCVSLQLWNSFSLYYYVNKFIPSNFSFLWNIQDMIIRSSVDFSHILKEFSILSSCLYEFICLYELIFNFKNLFPFFGCIPYFLLLFCFVLFTHSHATRAKALLINLPP